MQQRLNFPVIQKTNAKAGPPNTLPLPRSNPLPRKQAPTLVGPPACPEIAELEGVERQRDCLHVLVEGATDSRSAPELTSTVEDFGGEVSSFVVTDSRPCYASRRW
jgi:hypothetical protein